ncbi:DUF5682 family protein [Actinomyces oricola]
MKESPQAPPGLNENNENNGDNEDAGAAGAAGPTVPDPRASVTALAASREPYLIGVRHHSPALAAVLPALLQESDPQVLAIELPAQAATWLPWLTHPRARAPLALAFSQGGDLAFYPFADFSPELVALRWARERGVPVVCIDRPMGQGRAGAGGNDSGDDAPKGPASGPGGGPDPDGITERAEAEEPESLWSRALATRARAGAHDTDETWDRLVEAVSPGATPEQLRVAALAHGWALRRATGPIDEDTAEREASMRATIATELAAGRRVTALVGAFHTPALLGIGPSTARAAQRQERLWEPDGTPPAQPPNRNANGETTGGRDRVPGCVVGYSFAQLDARSGYPAGIRDPGWQQAVVESGLDPARLKAATTAIVTSITRALRAAGHPAGPGEAAETVRVACDLATLRHLAAPSRRELIEAATTVLAQGEVLGRGQIVARALEQVLIGQKAGAVAPGTPVSALRATVRQELEALDLPLGQSAALSLAPLRGGNDLERHVLLHRLRTGAIRYADLEQAQAWRGAETVTETWHLDWSAATDASIELAAARGLTPLQVATTALMTRTIQDAAQLGQLLTDAAHCACGPALERALEGTARLASTAGFREAVALSTVLADIARARLPGAALVDPALRARAAALREELTSAALRELRGLHGSDDPADAAALAAFAALATAHELSLAHALSELVAQGSPLMQGAAAGLLLDEHGAPGRIAFWLAAPTIESRRALRRRLSGLLLTAGPRFDTAPATLALIDEVGALNDDTFVTVLPALRGGFDILDPQTRQEMLRDLAHLLGPAGDLVSSPEQAVAAAQYDTRARGRLAALGLADLAFSPAQRWRLILGEERQRLSPQGRRLASALDELYGRPAADALDEGQRRAGTGPSQLGARQWRGEIEALFGAGEVQEILGQAVEKGRTDVLEQLDPDSVRPSVELLTTALSLTGALPESRLARLRPLVARLVAALTEQLAIRLRPALTGLAGARPTRRRVGRLDLERTLRTNLGHVATLEGRPQVIPVHPVFRQPAARQADWHLIVVVDVSGSMSQSVVFSALTAAILAGVACLEVTFLAFSTSVIDFSGQVDDPLALLLEVEVGGGTDIAGAMRVARSRVKVPGRTLCALVSDFEEAGPTGPLLGEVEALHASGVRLLGCAALNDTGEGAYNVGIAQQLAGAGMRVAALSPLDLAHWVGRVVRS